MFIKLRRRIAVIICPEIETERRAANRAALMDSLTGLANRRAFDLARRRATTQPETVFVVFDINNFKAVNDTRGHAAGDKILIEAAQSLTEAAADFDLQTRVFRTGGDEFAIICPAEFAGAIRRSAEMLFGQDFVAGRPVSISGGIGKTYEAADAAAYERKKETKQNYVEQ